MQLCVSEEFYADLRLAGDMTEICTALNTFAFLFRIRLLLLHDQQKQSHTAPVSSGQTVTIGSLVQTVFVNRGLDGYGASSNN
jgi:hypothetical protein